MQKLLCFTTLFLVSVAVWAQSLPRTETDYLEKSRKQKKAAKWMVYGGAALITIGASISIGSYVSDPLLSPSASNGTLKAGNIIAWTGAGVCVASIPLFLASSRNKKRAASVTLKKQSLQLPSGSEKYYLALSCRVGL